MAKKAILLFLMLGITVAVVIGPLIWPFIQDDINEYFSRIPFDSDVWRNADLRDIKNPVRLRMVDDLLKRHRPVGMTKDEIDELLGERTDTPYFREYDYVYVLGPERGFISIDFEWLVIKFENDRVVKAGVATD